MGLVTWWIFFYGFELLSAEPDVQFFFLSLEYLAIPWISGFLVWFSLEFGGYERYCTKNRLIVIFLIPAIIFIGFFSDSLFHLFYKDITFISIDSLTIMTFTPGIIFRLLNVANICAELFCLFTMVQVLLRSPRLFRTQMVMLVCSTVLLCMSFSAYFLFPRPYPNFDVMPIFLAIIGVLLLITILRFRFFDLIHIPYHSIFENLDEGIIVLDQQNRIIQINKKASALLDQNPDIFMGRDLTSVDSIFSQYYDKLIEKNHTTIRIEYTKDDIDFCYFIDMYPVYNSSNKLQNRMIITRDITEITRTTKALSEAGKKLNLLNSITRHDILNQVAIISGYSGIMLQEHSDNLDPDNHLLRIKNASDSIQKLIRFTATYKDLGVSRPVWLNVSDVAQKAFKTLHAPDCVILEVKTDLLVFSDMLLEKVFFNLMENSLRHGESVTRITICSYMADNRIILVYEDDGCGVEPEMKKKIFSRGIGKNTGYGLFLVAEILSITSIDIRETGTYGSGVRFEMSIPPTGVRDPRWEE
jgi:PAS domain S-box-containing protein